jgi:hypothetical protein
MKRLITSSVLQLKNSKPEPVWLSITNMGYGYVNNDWLMIFRSAFQVIMAISLLAFSYSGANPAGHAMLHVKWF